MPYIGDPGLDPNSWVTPQAPAVAPTPAPSTGGIGGLLGGAQNFLTGLGGIASAWDNLQGAVNPVTGRDYDVTAPGVTTRETGSALADISAPLFPQTIQAAQDLYNQGVTPLNPLQQAYYNQGAGLIGQAAGTDAATQQLATQAATAAGTPFTSSFGSARHAAAANRAASDAILNRQAQARQELGNLGQQYYDWQDRAPWQNLQRFQQATQFGQHVPTTSTTVTAPSGADIYQAELGRQLIENNIQAAGGTVPGQPQYASGAVGSLQRAGDIVGGVSNLVQAGSALAPALGGIASGVGDFFGGLFAEGGEVPEGYHKMPDGSLMKGEMHKEGYADGGMVHKPMSWDDVL